MSGQGETKDNRVNVLVVDDEPRLADLFAAWLEPNWSVTTAYDGAEALEKVNGCIDLVLLDRRMPGLSGDEVLSLLRDSGYDCSVIMVSVIDLAVETAETRFDEYLVKPISKSQLVETVECVSGWVQDGPDEQESSPLDSAVK